MAAIHSAVAAAIIAANAGGGKFILDYVISGAAQSINVRALALAAGWTPDRDLEAYIVITSTGLLGSASAIVPAFATGVGFTPDSVIYLQIAPGGRLISAGGRGGNAGITPGAQGEAGQQGGTVIQAQHRLIISNNGIIRPGGGGGGGAPYDTDDQPGGGGGGGQGYPGGVGGIGGYDQSANGTNGTLFAPGQGNIMNGSANSRGGNGGGLATQGSPSQPGFSHIQNPGGHAGILVFGGQHVTWDPQGDVAGVIV